MASLIERIAGDFGDKKRYRQYKERITQLPEGYRVAAAALERYLLNLGPSDSGSSLVEMLNDLADLLEQNAAAGTSIRDVVGSDPADFADTFMENYAGGSWIRKEKVRLAEAIDKAAELDGSASPGGGERS